MISELKRAGHVPSLIAALVHFDVSFMCWVLIGALGIAISQSLGLEPWQKGLAVGIPLVAGSLFRLIVGPQVDRHGPRVVGAITLVLTAAALALGWTRGRSFTELLAIGVLLGVAGSSFVVALPLAGRAFEPHLRGLAMGIAGAGNSGTVVAALVAPRLAARFGWHAVMGLAIIPVVGALAVFLVSTKRTTWTPSVGSARIRDVWQTPDARSLAKLYLVTFGGFVGSVSFLPVLLHDRYAVGPAWAAGATAICAGAGSLLRPVGGALADRLSGERILPVVFLIAATALIGVAISPAPVVAVVLLTIAVGALGAGNGAVFQIVPRAFPVELGAVTGLVGAAGGLGGFLLPFALGVTRTWTGTYTIGLIGFALACLAGLGGLLGPAKRWRDGASSGRAEAVPATT